MAQPLPGAAVFEPLKLEGRRPLALLALAASAALHCALLSALIFGHERLLQPFSGRLVAVDVTSLREARPASRPAASVVRPNAEKAAPAERKARAPAAMGSAASPATTALWSAVCDSFSSAERKALDLPDCGAETPPKLTPQEIATARAAAEKRLKDLALKQGWRPPPGRPSFRNPAPKEGAMPDYYARMGMQNPIPPHPLTFGPLSHLMGPDGAGGE